MNHPKGPLNPDCVRLKHATNDSNVLTKNKPTNTGAGGGEEEKRENEREEGGARDTEKEREF